MSKGLDYRELLKGEYERRKGRNAGYSLRAFSRMLQVSPAQLSQVLSGKRPLTPKTASKIADRLNFSPSQRSSLIESTVWTLQNQKTLDPEELREQEFKLISQWYHFAILSLSELPDHKADPRWIAAKIGIEVPEAAQALERLQALQIVSVKNGRIEQLVKPIKTSSDIPSAAIRLYHQQNLDKAKQKLEEVPVGKREFSSITMAVSTKNIAQAKRLITDFKRKVSALLEEGEKDSVYTLAVQLFPITKLESS